MKTTNLFRLGTDSMESPQHRRIVFSNAVYLFSVAAFSLLLLINAIKYYSTGISSDNFILSLFLVISIGCLFLNHLRLAYLSKVTFLMAWAIFALGFPLWRNGQDMIGYLVQPLIGVTSSTITLLMLSLKKNELHTIFF